MQLKTKIGFRKSTPSEVEQFKNLNAALDAEVAVFQSLLAQIANDLESSPAAESRLEAVEDTVEMQRMLRELSQRTGTKAVAIYVLMGREHCRTLLITPEKITAAAAKIKNQDLNDKALRLLKQLQTPALDPRPLSKELYELIFRPIESDVAKSEATLLMWSLDRSLRYLPMAALWDGQQYLAERYQHTVFTRPSPERLLVDVNRTWTGLGFGSSRPQPGFNPLPGVPRELGLIFGGRQSKKQGILRGTVLQDAQFTKQAFLDALTKQKPLVHIASHFRFRPGDDSASFLLLGSGEKLTLTEMKQDASRFRGVELLTLSACSTAAQQANAFGREIDGFAELAQRLGAGAVMASLWEVSDNSTPDLMADFYRLRQSGDGMTKAAALQQAQLAMLQGKRLPGVMARVPVRRSDPVKEANQPDDALAYKPDSKRLYAHPYYWAPFILIGNWR